MLLAASLDVFRRQTALFTFTLAVGAACWPIGVALWAAGAAVHEVVAWWLGFLILTIAGERLELSRFLPPSPFARRAFAAGPGGHLRRHARRHRPWGAPLFAAGLVALAALAAEAGHRAPHRAQQGAHPVHRRVPVVRLRLAGSGRRRRCSPSGSFVPGTAAYDAALHALTLGFVFSMVFGHAAIIFPAVLRVAVPYHPTFYLPLALLHLSLACACGSRPATRPAGSNGRRPARSCWHHRASRWPALHRAATAERRWCAAPARVSCLRAG